MSVVVRGFNFSNNSSFRVDMKLNQTDEAEDHHLFCKVSQSDRSEDTKVKMFMSVPEFQSYLSLLIQNNRWSMFSFAVPGFPEVEMTWEALQDISTQDQIAECIEVFKSQY